MINFIKFLSLNSQLTKLVAVLKVTDWGAEQTWRVCIKGCVTSSSTRQPCPGGDVIVINHNDYTMTDVIP